MEENKNNKKKILILGILLVIVTIGVLGITYAAYNFQREGDSNELVTGDIYMHYKGKNAGISIDNAVPSKTYDKEKYFEFTIEGKNTYTEKDIWYEIDLVDGDVPEGRTIRINDKYLRFALTEQIGIGPEKTVVNSVGYDDITNKKIWVNKIDRNTNNEITITYKLYMWISDEVHIGYDDENEIQSDYTPDEWNNDVFASVKVNVKGDFIEKSRDLRPLPDDLPTNLLERIKKLSYYRDGETIELNVTDKNNVTKCESVKACAEKEEIEYRYSGPEVNNYIYLKDNNNRDELWRIIGVFKDDEVGEYIKIVRDAVLPAEKIADYYIANGQKYKIKNSGVKVYWNKLEPSTSSEKNNWSTSGLQYWLNAEDDDTEGNKGYLSYLSSEVKEKLVSVKQYLGTVHIDDVGYVMDTPKQAYVHERDVVGCIGGKGASGSNSKDAIESESSGCHVWAGNDATWNDGKVSLMYPSDYGFTASETNWTTKLGANVGIECFRNITTSWAYSTMSDVKSINSWMLSPTSYSASSEAYWYITGGVHPWTVYRDGYGDGVRPVLNLSSSTTWLDGDGTKNNPYVIIPD